MKKIFKGLFYLMPVFMILLMIFSYGQRTTPTAGAVSTIDYKTITFINNNTDIASVVVPYGMSINEYNDTNLISNSDFYTKNSSLKPNGFNISPSFNQRTLNNVTGLALTTDVATRWYDFFRFNIRCYAYRGQKMTFTIKINAYNGVDNIVRLVTQDGFIYSDSATNSSNVNTPLTANSTISLTTTIPDTASLLSCQLYRRTTDLFYCDISWCKLEIGDTFTGYFNLDALEREFLVNNLTLNDLNFSLSPYTNLDWTLDTQNYFNQDVYITPYEATFTLGGSWSNILSDINSSNFLTGKVFENFNTYGNKILNLVDTGYNGNPLQTLANIFSTLYYLFMVIINVVALFVAPFIDLFGLILSLFFKNTTYLWL